MILYKLIAIFFSVLLLVQAYVIKVSTGSYLLPASLFSFVWFLFTIIPLVLLFNVPVNPLAILYIFLAISAFSFSAIPFNWKYAILKNKEKELTVLPELNSKFIHLIRYLSVILSITFSILIVTSNGFPVQAFFTDFISTTARYAALRGNEYLEYGIIGTLSTFFTHFSAVLGAIVTFYKKSKTKRFLSFLMSITPSLFAMLTQSSKLVFFVAIIFYLSTTLLMKIYSGKHFLFNISDIFKLIGISLLLLPLIIIAFVSRDGYSDFNNSNEAINLLLPAINSYFFGSMYAFCDFFSFYMGFHSMSNYKVEYYNLGYDSFKSVFDLFGGTKVFPPGYYNDNYFYKDVLATNIYTAFRGFIQDFGCLGTIIFMYLLGLFFHFSFYKLLVKRDSWLAGGIFIMFFGFACYSFLISIFVARYIFLITLSFYFVLTINGYINRKKSRLN
ncbi:MAG: hypothetical protein JWP44_4404 [Mucilaginibacter sp.]|nr:hypothetical protein [Mucilaginibacter sp.]